MLYTKVNSKWIKDPEKRSETIKYTEKNTGQALQDIDLRGIFNYLNLLARITTINRTTSDTKFLYGKSYPAKIKRKNTEQGKTFVHYPSDKGLITKMLFLWKHTNNFTMRTYGQQKDIKKCYYYYRNPNQKAIIWYPLIPVRMSYIKRMKATSVGRDAMKENPHSQLVETSSGSSPMENSMEISLSKK